MKSIPDLILELEQLIPEHKKASEKVSSASVGWHIGHTLMGIIRIGQSLIHSTPTAVKSSFNFKRVFVMTLGRIPRGRGKAPEAVRPVENISPDELRELVVKARSVLTDLAKAPKDSNFMHPVFGPLQKKDSIRFIQIHTNHHLRIIKDIIIKPA